MCFCRMNSHSKIITATPICRWADRHLHLSRHNIILILLVYFHPIDRLINKLVCSKEQD